jgi:hypothetical protein
MRWITLIGRIGTVLLMVGVALILVSFIPPATGGSRSLRIGPIPPETYWIEHSSTYTPQRGLRISVESNNSVYVYLLSVSQFQIENLTRTWLRETFPDLEEAQIFWRNVTVLEAVLQGRSEIVLWKSASAEELSYDFFPSTVLNITAIVANPSSSLAQVTVEITDITTLAPRERVIVPAQWLIPIGVVLAVPWLVLSKTKRD